MTWKTSLVRMHSNPTRTIIANLRASVFVYIFFIRHSSIWIPPPLGSGKKKRDTPPKYGAGPPDLDPVARDNPDLAALAAQAALSSPTSFDIPIFASPHYHSSISISTPVPEYYRHPSSVIYPPNLHHHEPQSPIFACPVIDRPLYSIGPFVFLPLSSSPLVFIPPLVLLSRARPSISAPKSGKSGCAHASQPEQYRIIPSTAPGSCARPPAIQPTGFRYRF
ncbi:hypothetical protein F4818DRAFT_153099 [Hypoxylon cercidicola]|nr:hypothetical protein F4818DRAFT_153099 [Hypoxylon cercidicola]